MKKEILILAGIILSVLVFGVLVMAADDTAASTATVNVNSFLSVTVDDTTLAFGTLDPLATGKPTGDPLTATIGDETNVGSIFVKTKADATDLVCTGGGCSVSIDKFAISYLEWDLDDTFTGTAYTQTDATVCSGLSANGFCDIYHELEIPSAQAAGDYSVGITITATTT